MVNQKFTNENDRLVWHDQLLWCEIKGLKNSCEHVWSVVDLLVLKDNSWMRKGANMQNNLIEKVEIPKDSFDIINGSVPKEPQVPEIVEMMRSQ